VLTIHMRGPNGEPLYDGEARRGRRRVPVTITVTPIWAPATQLPAGDVCRAANPVIARSVLAPIVDHVKAWHGWRIERGKPPLACTRENVFAVLEGRPDLAAQVLDAIKADSQPRSTT